MPLKLLSDVYDYSTQFYFNNNMNFLFFRTHINRMELAFALYIYININITALTLDHFNAFFGYKTIRNGLLIVCTFILHKNSFFDLEATQLCISNRLVSKLRSLTFSFVWSFCTMMLHENAIEYIASIWNIFCINFHFLSLVISLLHNT